MIKKQFRFSVVPTLAACAALLGSCAVEETLNGDPDGPRAVSFTAGIGGVTRTTNGGDHWVSTDRVGIYMLTAGGKIPADIVPSSDNVPYMATNINNATADLVPNLAVNAITYPSAGNYDFIAYYPYDEYGVSSEGLYNGIDLTDQSNPAAIDVLVARKRGVATSSVNLVFKHVLSKITINFKAGTMPPADVANMSSVTLSGTPGNVYIDMNAAEGSDVTAFGRGDIILHKETTPTATFDATFTAILAPHAAVAGRKLSATIGGRTIVWGLPQTDAFDQGIHYFYSATVDLNSVNFGTSTITPWVPDVETPLEAEKIVKNHRITWDDADRRYILTTDPTDAGLYFQFGSVIGIYSGHAGNQTLPDTNTDEFDAPDVPWNPGDVMAWTSIPRYDGTTDYPKAITPEDGYHTIENIKAGKGDPCRLVGLDLLHIESTEAEDLTVADIDNGEWRLPTRDEWPAFTGREENNAYYDHWYTLAGVTGGMFPNTTLGGDETFLPAAGRRRSSDDVYMYSAGQVQYQSTDTWYWSSTPNSTTAGCNLYFSWSRVDPLGGNEYASGLSVRCVRQ